MTEYQEPLNSCNESQALRMRMDSRRLSKFQNCGLFAEDKSGAEYSRATSASDLCEAYRLVYKVFADKGYVLPNQSGMRIRVFELSPDTATFVAKVAGTLVGVIGLVVDSDDIKLPSDKAFVEELETLRTKGTLVCEVTNQAVEQTYRSSSVTTELMRCAWAQAWATGCTDMICSISPRQRKFYEFIGFEMIGNERSYSKDIYDPVVLMSWNLASQKERWQAVDISDDTMDTFWKSFFLTNNPYISQISPWTVLAKKTFENSYELCALFGNCKELFLESDPLELEALKARLGSAFYFSYKNATGSTYFSDASSWAFSYRLKSSRHGHGRARTLRFLSRHQPPSAASLKFGGIAPPSLSPRTSYVK